MKYACVIALLSGTLAVHVSVVAAGQHGDAAVPYVIVWPQSPDAPTPECPVTRPNRHSPPVESEQMPPGAAQFWHGNSSLGTALWPEGRVVFKPGGPGAVLPDGSLRMKFLWLKTAGTHLRISGHRVDDPTIVLRTEVDRAFDTHGIQPSYLIFRTPGCWRVTASVGRESVSFITAVVRIERGPRGTSGL